jgi:acyl-CoA thioesterase-1
MGFKFSVMRSLLLAVLIGCSGKVFAAPTILVFGDSLSAAYGIAQNAGWVSLLGQRLKQSQLDYTVANESISGETTAGGAARIQGALARHKPDIVIVELGANDGLRGLPAAQIKVNLNRVIEAAKRSRARVLLVGMQIPPNYGTQYAQAFRRTFEDLAREHKLPLVPFFLQGVADKRDLFQADALHPTAEAQPMILDNVWKQLRPLLGERTASTR